MLRNNIVPLVLVAGCGVFTVITTFQPELQKQRSDGSNQSSTGSSLTTNQHDTAISSAIKEDLQAARQELGQTLTQPRGFAWGIRQAVFGKTASNQTSKEEEVLKSK